MIPATEFRDARRAVANAKLVEFRRQCWRLAGLVDGIASKQDVTDLLWEIAIAHALVRALGEDRVEAIIAEAFAGSHFQPMNAEGAIAYAKSRAVA
jgi:hypothetical protein